MEKDILVEEEKTWTQLRGCTSDNFPATQLELAMKENLAVLGKQEV